MRTVALSVFLLLACLVASFAQKDLQLMPLADDARQQTSAPRIEIIHPINSHDLPPNQALSYVSTSRNLRIAGLVADDQGIAEVTVNGQPVKLMPPGGKDLLLVQLEGQTVGFEVEIPLSDSNTILITARDTQGNLSERKLEVEYRTRDGLQQATGRRWALIIGVEDYQDPQITDLRYSIDDARALYEVLIDPKRGGFETDHVKLLTDDATDSKLLPTRLNILDALNNWLRQTIERDTVIFYFSGHGIADKHGRNYLVAMDSKLNLLEDSAVPMERVNEVLDDPERVRARKVVVILDSCHSGARAGAKGEAEQGKVLDPFFTEADGRMTIASCGVDEQSFEDEEIGHGVFTHYLVEGLKGSGDSDQDGIITATELSTFVQNEVREWAWERGRQQNPRRQMNVSGGIWLALDPEYGSQEYQRAQLEKLYRSRKLSESEYQDALTLLTASQLTAAQKSERTALQDLLSHRISLKDYRTIIGRQRGIGMLEIQSTPAGATLFINGQYAGVTPHSGSDYPVGSYTVEVSKDGYMSLVREIQIEAGKTTALRLNLTQQARGKGTLLVQTKPLGAAVYIDGDFRGHAPIMLKEVPAGQRRVRLEISGKPPYETTITIQDGQTVKLPHQW